MIALALIEVREYILEQIPSPEIVNLEMSRDGSGAGVLGATKPIVVELVMIWMILVAFPFGTIRYEEYFWFG